MSDSQVPLWVTIIGSFGVGTFVGNLISHWLTSEQPRKNWVNDNKKLEWRELIDELEVAMTTMRHRFAPDRVVLAPGVEVPVSHEERNGLA